MVTTLILAVLVMGLALVCLGIGYILTGQSKLKKRCGYSLNKKDECPLCSDHTKKCPQKKDREKDDNCSR